MVINFNIQPNAVKESTLYSNKDIGSHSFACVDKGSYIAGSKIECNDNGLININIGRFCAVAHEVIFIVNLNHDYKSAAMGASDLFCYDEDKVNTKRKAQIILQNDVWIGRGATIMSGVIIHNGGVVAANSHVVKDVPPYAIVGGNPAKIIGYRFDKDIIEKMLNISWWYWNDEKIRENSIYFKDVNKLCDMFYNNTEDTKSIEELEELNYKNRYLFFMDFIEDFYDESSIWQKVAKEFIDVSTEDELLIFYINTVDYEKNKNYIDNISEEIDRAIEVNNKKCNIGFYIGEKENEQYAFKYFNYFIVNGGVDTVRHTCYADKYNVKILSGADIPVFR